MLRVSSGLFTGLVKETGAESKPSFFIGISAHLYRQSRLHHAGSNINSSLPKISIGSKTRHRVRSTFWIGKLGRTSSRR
jgi:hypothetical protein